MSIAWDQSLETGVAEIDRDHRCLFDMINSLDRMLIECAGYERIGPLIDALTEYAENHFRREEEMLARLGWEALPRHAEGHTRFALGLGALVAGCMIEPGDTTLGQLRDHLEAWLVSHIRTEDMAFAAFVRERVAAGR